VSQRGQSGNLTSLSLLDRVKFLTVFVAGVFDQDAAHRLGCRREEVPAAFHFSGWLSAPTRRRYAS
jgi:hypothetical protein